MIFLQLELGRLLENSSKGTQLRADFYRHRETTNKKYANYLSAHNGVNFSALPSRNLDNKNLPKFNFIKDIIMFAQADGKINYTKIETFYYNIAKYSWIEIL